MDDTNLISGLSKTRIEALTDGIFAIAMTLMVFDTKVPALTQMNQLNLRHELIQRCVFFPGLFVFTHEMPGELFRARWKKMRTCVRQAQEHTMAVEQIWNESSDRLGQFIRARVADPATAEDILHDVFVKFLSRLDEFREPAKVQGWLFLVARNAIIDHYRTRKPTSELPQSLPTELPRIDVTEMEDLRVAHFSKSWTVSLNRIATRWCCIF